MARVNKIVLTPPELKISPTAEYVTSGGAELRLKKDNSLWEIYFFRGGELPSSLSGKFLTRTDAHRAIVLYLQSDNVRGNARWPQ